MKPQKLYVLVSTNCNGYSVALNWGTNRADMLDQARRGRPRAVKLRANGLPPPGRLRFTVHAAKLGRALR